jgi:AmiR/NasT family two-component response regulator
MCNEITQLAGGCEKSKELEKCQSDIIVLDLKDNQ